MFYFSFFFFNSVLLSLGTIDSENERNLIYEKVEICNDLIENLKKKLKSSENELLFEQFEEPLRDILETTTFAFHENDDSVLYYFDIDMILEFLKKVKKQADKNEIDLGFIKAFTDKMRTEYEIFDL